MLLVILIILLGLLLWHVIHVIRTGPESINLFVVIPLLAALGLGGYWEASWWASEKTGSGLVVYASGVDGASLDCQRPEETLLDVRPFLSGFVNWDNPTVANLKYRECDALFSYLKSDKINPTSEQAYALEVLVHEAMHVSGIRNEAETECAAIARYVDVAVQSGASQEVAERMLDDYLQNWWPRLPNSYKSSCT